MIENGQRKDLTRKVIWEDIYMKNMSTLWKIYLAKEKSIIFYNYNNFSANQNARFNDNILIYLKLGSAID